MAIRRIRGSWACECFNAYVVPKLRDIPHRSAPSWCGTPFLDLKPTSRRLFMDIEDICESNGFGVLEYVRDSPLYAAAELSKFSPYQYVSDTFVDAFAGKVWTNSPRYLWYSQIQYLVYRSSRLVPSRFATMEDLLLDLRQPFAAWFRVLYPRSRDHRLVEMYGNEAREEVLADPLLKDFLVGMVPVVDLTRIGVAT